MSSDLAMLWQQVRTLHNRLDQFEETVKKESPKNLSRAIRNLQEDRQRVRTDWTDERPEDVQSSEDLRNTLVDSIKRTGRIPDTAKAGGDPGWDGPEVNR